MGNAAYLVYLIPFVFIGGWAVYYFLVYQKGKAAGGGLMEGFAAVAREKWASVLAPGEDIVTYGHGVLWRPWWQWTARQWFPFTRLFFPYKAYQIVVTTHRRMLRAEYGILGLSNHQAYDARAVRIEGSAPEATHFLQQVLGTGNWRTFEVVLSLPDGPLRLQGVPEPFLQALSAAATS